MIRTLAATAALLLAAACSSGPSIDQQQQAWEQEQREDSCASIKRLQPGSLERGWAIEDAAEGRATGDDVRTLAGSGGGPYTCSGPVFERYVSEYLVEDFPESPKGQAGETTNPAPR